MSVSSGQPVLHMEFQALSQEEKQNDSKVLMPLSFILL